MKIDIVVRPGLQHQANFALLVAKGLCRYGVQTRIVSSDQPITADVTACWGWRQGSMLARRGKRVLVMERGYIGDRFKWTSLGWDGLNGHARWPQIEDGGERFRKHFADLMLPERESGVAGYALVLGQVPGDMSIQNVDLDGFYRMAANRMATRFGAQVCFRPHPVHVKRGQRPGAFLHGMVVTEGTLEDDLAGAACAVAWNSNALTDAVLAGVPVIAMNEGAMVWPIAGHGLDDQPSLQGREAWAHRVAWSQWSNEEIASGEAWEAVVTVMEPASCAA